MTGRDRIYAAILTVVLVAALIGLGWAIRDNQDGYTPNDAGFPVFNCQEDELMVWVDARNTSECVNIDEYEHHAHVRAGHVDE